MPVTAARTQPSSHGSDVYANFVLRVNAVQPISIGQLTPYYEANSGQSIEAETSFEAGSVGVTVGWSSLLLKPSDGVARVPDQPLIRAKLMGLNWRFPPVAIGRLQLRAGVRVATFRLSLPDTLVSRKDRTEDELSLGLTASGAVQLSHHLSFVVGSDVSQVFANVPWMLRTVSAGVEWHHAMPERIRKWLQ